MKLSILMGFWPPEGPKMLWMATLLQLRRIFSYPSTKKGRDDGVETAWFYDATQRGKVNDSVTTMTLCCCMEREGDGNVAEEDVGSAARKEYTFQDYAIRE